MILLLRSNSPVAKGLHSLYDLDVEAKEVHITRTRKEFEGDFTVVIFQFVKKLGILLPDLGSSIGDFIMGDLEEVETHNLVKGFLNIELKNSFWVRQLAEKFAKPDYCVFSGNGKKSIDRILFTQY